MRLRRDNWSEPGVGEALVLLAADDHKGNHKRRALPPGLHSDAIAQFLHFDSPLPNQLYVIGGRNQQDGPLSSVEMFDTWHGRWVSCPSMAVRRAGCDVAALPDQRILCVGGYDERGIVRGLLASCEVFDPRLQTWSSQVAPLESARWGHGCAAINGLVYAVGGCSLQPGAPPREAFMETLRRCEVYDPKTNRWSPAGELQMARAGTRVVVVGDRYLAAVGGCDDVFGRAEIIPTIEVYDISIGRWAVLDTHLSNPRTTAAVAALEDDRILVIGGAPSLSASEVFHLTAAVGQAQPCAIDDLEEGRMGSQAALVQLPLPGASYPDCTRKYAVVIGGESGEDEGWDSVQQRTHVRQFNSTLAYDTVEDRWCPEVALPAMATPRTAMAVCVGHGQIRGYPLYSKRARPRGGC